MPGFAALLPSIITAGGSLLGSALGFGSQAKTNKDNMKLAEYQYSKNLEMWQRQNEYNKPINQRNRLIEAGLNPALMYGSGKVANVVSDAPQFQAPTLQAYNNFGDLGSAAAVNAYNTFEQKIAEVNNITEDSHLKSATRLLQIWNKLKVMQEIAEGRERLAKIATEKEFWRDNAVSARDLAQYTADNARREGDRITALSDNIKAQTETEDSLRPQRVANEVKRGQSIDAQTKYYNAQTTEALSAAALNKSKQKQVEQAIIDDHNLKVGEKEMLIQKLRHAQADYENKIKDGEIKTQQERSLYWDNQLKQWESELGQGAKLLIRILSVLK